MINALVRGQLYVLSGGIEICHYPTHFSMFHKIRSTFLHFFLIRSLLELLLVFGSKTLSIQNTSLVFVMLPMLFCI